MRERAVAGAAIGVWGLGLAIGLSGLSTDFWVWPAMAVIWGAIYAWRGLSLKLAAAQFVSIVIATSALIMALPTGGPAPLYAVVLAGVLYSALFFGLWMVPVAMIAQFGADGRIRLSRGNPPAEP